jgi:hypothetical protein
MSVGRIFIVSGVTLLCSVIAPATVFSQTSSTVDVNTLVQKATVSFSPKAGSFTQGSLFEVPIMIDTHGKSVNAVELYVQFDPRKLTIVDPVGRQSAVGVWVEPPTYSNSLGTLKLIGTIPGGITTAAGLIAKITFKGIASGESRVTFLTKSQVLANDGLGSEVVTNFGSASYTIVLQPPEGPRVFSETHPFSEYWYNNNTPVLAWDKEEGVSAYSFVVDDKPFTIPDNESDTTEQRMSVTDIQDGLRYFHIKAKKGSVWGGTTHFMFRLDTMPPADFTPSYERIASGAVQGRVLISFFTTDSLSGIDHYEVGVLDKDEALNVSPVFVEATSPYQLPLKTSGNVRVLVRAYDAAGNVIDKHLDIRGFSFVGFIKGNIVALLVAVLLVVMGWLLVSYYLFTRRVSKALLLSIAPRDTETPALPTPLVVLPPKPVKYKIKKPPKKIIIKAVK